jgi:hypothetical protein
VLLLGQLVSDMCSTGGGDEWWVMVDGGRRPRWWVIGIESHGRCVIHEQSGRVQEHNNQMLWVLKMSAALNGDSIKDPLKLVRLHGLLGC